MAPQAQPPKSSLAEVEERIANVMKLMSDLSSSHNLLSYHAQLGNLRREAEEIRQAEAMAGLPGTYSMPSSPGPLDTLPIPVIKQEPTVLSRKRGLDAEWPEPKRASRQQSPTSSTSPVEPLYHRALPTRTMSNAALVVEPSSPTFYDLTVSNPPSPEPFPELEHAYREGHDSGYANPTAAFDQHWMGEEDLAAFMIQPTTGSQPQRLPQPRIPTALNQEVPYFPGPDLSPWASRDDSEIYGEVPLMGYEIDAIEKLFENINDHGEIPEDREPTPEIMTCVLKDYQRIGLTWLLKMERGNSKGGILADEMGLGKTVQALALMCANPSQDSLCKTTLIIAPVALMRQWEKEISRHVHQDNKLSVYLYHGSGKNADFSRLRTYDVVMTTFGTLTSEFKKKEDRVESNFVQQESSNPGFRRKAKDKLALLGRECMWYRVIIDEAHNIKNRNSKSSKAVSDLQARHRLCMTGTPMMNSMDELYPLLRFLKIEPYNEWSHFNYDIGKPIRHHSRRSRKKAMNRVQILLRSVMLRRLKTSKVDGNEICTIPPKHTETANVEFSSEEFELYKALETKSQLQMNKFIEKGTVTANYANVLVLLLRLRQACCHPHLIKDLSQPATEGIDEADLLERARMLDDTVVIRLKAFDSFECPICLEADPNPTIIIPCGHTACGACVQKLVDPTRQEAIEDPARTAKCPHCRGELHARLITDYKHFCKIHFRERLDPADLDDEESSDDDSGISDSDSDEEDGYERTNKEGDLAGFVVCDEDEDAAEGERDDPDDSDYADAASSGSSSPCKADVKPAKKFKGRKGKGKGKGKARAEPKQTLAQLKKESLRNKAAKKKYLRRLEKNYVPSAKIDKTVELLSKIAQNDPTEKTLVFSQFTSLLDLVEIPLSQKRIRYQRYDGSMKMDERANAVNAFMDDPNQNVMLVSLKAGNAGLNLWKASQVIILDPFWNPFIEDQAVDRAHRMPQPREVTVHRVLVPETVEDRICVLQDKKREIIGAALDEQVSNSLTRLNHRELRYLFGMD